MIITIGHTNSSPESKKKKKEKAQIGQSYANAYVALVVCLNGCKGKDNLVTLPSLWRWNILAAILRAFEIITYWGHVTLSIN